MPSRVGGVSNAENFFLGVGVFGSASVGAALRFLLSVASALLEAGVDRGRFFLDGTLVVSAAATSAGDSSSSLTSSCIIAAPSVVFSSTGSISSVAVSLDFDFRGTDAPLSCSCFSFCSLLSFGCLLLDRSFFCGIFNCFCETTNRSISPVVLAGLLGWTTEESGDTCVREAVLVSSLLETVVADEFGFFLAGVSKSPPPFFDLSDSVGGEEMLTLLLGEVPAAAVFLTFFSADNGITLTFLTKIRSPVEAFLVETSLDLRAGVTISGTTCFFFLILSFGFNGGSSSIFRDRFDSANFCFLDSTTLSSESDNRLLSAASSIFSCFRFFFFSFLDLIRSASLLLDLDFVAVGGAIQSVLMAA
mmetsp:Transcript_36816/g.89399  ORF Transcript_36816/g.89399 Transcript_36816/m.89399 type:complete len:361 (-) Transcript_36816:1085-2167(-)